MSGYPGQRHDPYQQQQQGYGQNQYAPPQGPPQGYNSYAPPPQFNAYQQPNGPAPPMRACPTRLARTDALADYPSPGGPPPSFGPPPQLGGNMPVHYAPPPGAYQGSNSGGKRKALCIGINYVGTANALAGCHNDARNMSQFLCSRYQFARDDIVMLMDTPGAGPREIPTRANMVRGSSQR